ncbi:EF-P beta-lysylation protein EpmB [Gallaecimonas kandeliae]|uniref:EF-P beta-lysylation protein EpmB n=1 Tax=Gallaecimonas kandeliae TaxID=3029055 RepID=UPI002647F3F9|nr:EF-P beta-lysylation protein EpmB [Gallaecimonas kandeliae]WKE65015.1 EF-P beta-lysylation protein EpmB [Gallaecimonas kandeliae]
MPQMITAKAPLWELCWRDELKAAISDPLELARTLQLDTAPLEAGFGARRLFPLRVPRPFVALMEKGNAQDPLLRQVMTDQAEFAQTQGFSTDPLDEQDAAVPGLLHKYQSRVLFILKGGCAVNCRYCFRRHFPYNDNPGNKASWQQALDYIAARPEIEEVILSGGDPLMAKDEELAWLIERLNAIPHLKLLRIHSRLPVVIPSRIDQSFLDTLAVSRLPVTLVLHINHPAEVGEDLAKACSALRAAGVTLLNQSVLLAGINDDAQVLVALSHRLFAAGVLPYYLHVLDKVQGAAHFLVDDGRARDLMRQLNARLSGYLVPRLAREEAGKPGKTLMDLNL